MVTKVCHTVNTTLFPSVLGSMIQMAECDISLSLSLNGDDVGLFFIENDFVTLLRNHLSNVVNVLDNISAASCIL
jgi:hypothetical protein